MRHKIFNIKLFEFKLIEKLKLVIRQNIYIYSLLIVKAFSKRTRMRLTDLNDLFTYLFTIC